MTKEEILGLEPMDLLNNFPFNEKNKKKLDKEFHNESMSDEQFFELAYKLAVKQTK